MYLEVLYPGFLKLTVFPIRHHVLGSSGPGSGNCGLPPDDLDDDELWSSD